MHDGAQAILLHPSEGIMNRQPFHRSAQGERERNEDDNVPTKRQKKTLSHLLSKIRRTSVVMYFRVGRSQSRWMFGMSEVYEEALGNLMAGLVGCGL